MILGCTLIIFLILGVGIALIYYFHGEESKNGIILTTVFLVFLIAGVIAGTIWYYNSTESGKRELKDMAGNIKGGIERIVTVFDVNGQVIRKYEGKFDISYDNSRIKFDDEEGKRHVIYYTTGTVIIDEK